MPPFLRKLVQAKPTQTYDLRGGVEFFVEDAIAKSPNDGSSSSSLDTNVHQMGNSSVISGHPITHEFSTSDPESTPPRILLDKTFVTSTESVSSNEVTPDPYSLHPSLKDQLVTSARPSPQTVPRYPANSTLAIPIERPITAPRISYEQIVHIIPHFDGKSSEVGNFIAQCKLADSMVGAEHKNYLLTLARSRIQYRVYDSIVGENQPKTIDELVSLLKTAYARHFDLSTVLDELRTIRRSERETINEFGLRVQGILNFGIRETRENYDTEQFVGIKAILTENAIQGFLRGLRNDIIAGIVSRDSVKDLRLAITLASQIERNIGPATSSGNKTGFADNPRVLVAEARERQCLRCGKYGHIASNCWSNSSRQLNGPAEFTLRCRRCGKIGHSDRQCRRDYINRVQRDPRPPTASISTPKENDNPLNFRGAPSTGAIRREPLISRVGSTASTTKPV